MIQLTFVIYRKWCIPTKALLSPRHVRALHKDAAKDNKRPYNDTISPAVSTFRHKGSYKNGNSLFSYRGRTNQNCQIIKTNTHSRWILKVPSSWGKEIKKKKFINVFKAIRFLWFPFQTQKYTSPESQNNISR